jgi:exonuclease SbcC
MKIIKIQFKNINSLKGEHSINFDTVPLSTAGIFAIVGPTGSGKSTILDVITLALFNRIPRFSKSISKNEITKEGSVVTHHTKEAKASIEYEIKGKRYKSTWSVETNRNGKLKDYEMFFYKPDGTIADLKKSQVPSQNEAIIGLKYDQFVKSILLSQGEFSKFLKADKNERGALLENLTGTSIYRKLGLATYDKYREVKQKFERESDQIETINTLNETERKQIEEAIHSSEKERKILSKDITVLTDLWNIKREIKNIITSLELKEKKAIEIKHELDGFQKDQTKLDTHFKLSPIQGPLATYNNAVVNIESSRKNLKNQKSDLEKAKTNLQDSIEKLSKLTSATVDEQSFKKVMNDFETEINNADRDLANSIQTGLQHRTRVNQQKSTYGINLADNVKPIDALAFLSNESARLKTQISKSKLDTTKPLSESKESLKVKQELIKVLNSIQGHYQKAEDLKEKLNAESKKLENFINTKNVNTPLIAKCEKLIESKNQQISLLQKQKEDAIKIAELEDFRHSLVAGEQCPLCGSLDHPFANHDVAVKTNDIEEQLKATQLELVNHQNENRALTEELTKCTTSIDLTEKVIDEFKVEHTMTTEKIDQEIKYFKGTIDINKDNITKTIDDKTAEYQTLEAAIEAQVSLTHHIDLIGQYEELKQHSEEYTKLKNQRDAKFPGDNINHVTNQLQEEFETSKTRIAGLKSIINKEEEFLRKNLESIESIKSDLLPKIKELGFTNITDISLHLLDEHTLKELTQTRDSLNKARTSIDTELKNLKDELKNKQLLDTDQSMDIDVLKASIDKTKMQIEEHQEIYFTNQEKLNRDDADKKQKEAKEKSVTKLKVELEKWSLLSQLIGDATGNKFANFAQGLTLQNLLVYANRRLKNLTDRYLLDKPENEGSLIVIDNYQGNISRSVNTLSGGESFLISLALALSLSDMASKNVALECLFIDEGFGTLDPETLELAMTTLEKLQSESQKTVGVISHVDALKERIDVQIELKKNAQGYSSIDIVS